MHTALLSGGGDVGSAVVGASVSATVVGAAVVSGESVVTAASVWIISSCVGGSVGGSVAFWAKASRTRLVCGLKKKMLIKGNWL